jgi:hypothetical protein
MAPEHCVAPISDRAIHRGTYTIQGVQKKRSLLVFSFSGSGKARPVNLPIATPVSSHALAFSP